MSHKNCSSGNIPDSKDKFVNSKRLVTLHTNKLLKIAKCTNTINFKVAVRKLNTQNERLFRSNSMLIQCK